LIQELNGPNRFFCVWQDRSDRSFGPAIKYRSIRDMYSRI